MPAMIFLTALLFVAAAVIMFALVALIGRLPSWRALMSREVRASRDAEAWRIEQRVAAPWWIAGGFCFAAAIVWILAVPDADENRAIGALGFVCMTSSGSLGSYLGGRAARRYLKQSIR